MKRIQLSLLSFCLAVLAHAQVPQGIKYQSVVRDNAGVELVNQNVSFRISVLQGAESGPIVYSETQTGTTNAYGLANFTIGNGNVVSGDFATIDWSADTYFFKVDLDATGGSNYQFIGTSQALSVPYALHARTAESVIGGGDGSWTANGDAIHNANTGNVGVGIDAPEQQLDVQGNALVRGPGFNGIGDSATLYLGDTFTRVKNTFGTGLQLYAFPGTAPAMTIHTATNNVGIGTDQPASALHIARPVPMITLSDTDDNTSAYMLPPDPTNGATGGFGINGGDMKLFTDAGDRVTISSTTGNVGIGTADPQQTLDVAGNVVIGDGVDGPAINWRAQSDVGVDTSGTQYFNREYGVFTWARGPIDNSNPESAVGIWLARSANDVEPYADGLTNLGNPGYRWKDVYATNSVIQTSDERMKKNIAPLDMGLAEVMTLKPVTYEWKDPRSGDGPCIGFIAQEVEKVIPQAVVHRVIPSEQLRAAKEAGKPEPAITDPYGMKYTEITPVLVKAIQEQQAQIEMLKNEIEALKKAKR